MICAPLKRDSGIELKQQNHEVICLLSACCSSHRSRIEIIARSDLLGFDHDQLGSRDRVIAIFTRRVTYLSPGATLVDRKIRFKPVSIKRHHVVLRSDTLFISYELDGPITWTWLCPNFLLVRRANVGHTLAVRTKSAGPYTSYTQRFVHSIQGKQMLTILSTGSLLVAMGDDTNICRYYMIVNKMIY